MDNFKTYRLEESGVMTPMVQVWMTYEEHKAYQEHLAKGSVLAIPFVDEPAPVKVRKHVGHASPKSPAVYGKGTLRLSAERMKDFLDSYEKFYGNYKDIAADLSISVGSVAAYKSLAVRNGLLAGTTHRPAVEKDAISIDRAQEVATIYQIVKGNVKRVARALGVTEGTARTYVNIAKKRGLL